MWENNQLFPFLSIGAMTQCKEKLGYGRNWSKISNSRCTIFLLFISFLSVASSLGVNYGMIANNLPSPTQVVSIIRSISIAKSKIYTSDPNVLQAFGNTGISFIVAIDNGDVGSMTNPATASAWVNQHIGQFFPETMITCITVGNEIFAGEDTLLMSQLLPAMQNLQAAIVDLGLNGQIAISTPHSLAVLQSSFPPSNGSFKSELLNPYIKPLLEFLSQTSSPLMINAYPFFAYKSNPQEVSLDYVLFEPNPGVTDPATGLQYYNMFDAQVDAVYMALEALGYGHLEVMVSETGWPSAGDPDEAGATIENAEKYNTNLINHVSSGRGTPYRPGQYVETYIFALFNENMKPGPASERNYGLFYPDGTRVYNFPTGAELSSALHLYPKLCPSLRLTLICLTILLFSFELFW